MDAAFAVGREVFTAPYPAWTALGMVGAHDPGLEVASSAWSLTWAPARSRA